MIYFCIEKYESSKENKNLEEKIAETNFNSFFMTQGEQEDTVNNVEKEHNSKVDSRFKNYEILLNIENEDQIKCPKGKINFFYNILS